MPMMTETTYGISTRTSLNYADAVDRVTAELKTEGFGILATIDVQATLKEKLDVDMDRYVILGACNPPLAHQALEAETEIGLLLPCNVIVYERNGATHVAALDPIAAMGIVGNEALDPLGREARSRLEQALDRLPN